jgi:hypothetical protein
LIAVAGALLTIMLNNLWSVASAKKSVHAEVQLEHFLEVALYNPECEVA